MYQGAAAPAAVLSTVPCTHAPQTPQDQWEALKHLVAGNAPLAYNADGEAAAIVARLMEADVVLTTYQANLRSDLQQVSGGAEPLLACRNMELLGMKQSSSSGAGSDRLLLPATLAARIHIMKFWGLQCRHLPASNQCRATCLPQLLESRHSLQA
jgi:hypothetical protein